MTFRENVNRDEGTQIGYRIAAKADLRSVQGIDEQPGKGEPSYFPINAVEAYAKKHGEQAYLDAAFATVKASAQRFEAEQRLPASPRC